MGQSQNFYIKLPQDIGETSMHLSSAPEEYRAMKAQEVVALYLSEMEALIDEAKQRFQAG